MTLIICLLILYSSSTSTSHQYRTSLYAFLQSIHMTFIFVFIFLEFSLHALSRSTFFVSSYLHLFWITRTNIISVYNVSCTLIQIQDYIILTCSQWYRNRLLIRVQKISRNSVRWYNKYKYNGCTIIIIRSKKLDIYTFDHLYCDLHTPFELQNISFKLQQK